MNCDVTVDIVRSIPVSDETVAVDLTVNVFAVIVDP